MIHVLNFSDEIIDYISASDDAVIYAEHERNLNEQVETFKFSVLSKRASNLQHRNRIIIQDSNSKYREFIIEHVEQEGSYTEVECVASYLEDIKKAKPIEPMVLSKKSTHESLEKILAGTGWQTSDLTEYGGNKTTTWKNYQSRYDSLLQLKTTFSMTLDFYIELGAHTVNGRFVVLKKKSPLFKGKEIVYGKDLAGMKRTLNMSEVKTALIAQGPEQDNGNRIILEVKDDEAQSQFGLPEHYLWDIYEPETDDQNMTETRLRTLATTELNKRKKQAVTYEVISIDVKKLYPQEEIAIGDLVRVKDQEFNPPLYLEGEVIGEKYDLISGQSEWVFGEYVEYEEKALKSVFERKLDAIRQKLNDNFSNVNTIVKESLQGELQYFERKILKGDTPPDNPVNDLLWLDTSNPKVAVLRRYWNGKWIKSSAENAEDVGAVTREQALYSELSNTFVNLTIQHSRLMHEVSDVLESEYLIDTDIKEEVNSKLNDTIGVFNTIKSNLDSMTEETATIGALVDTQALFLDYRAKMQALYNTIENAKIAIDERFKLLQSQYTDEKFNDAMTEIANALPNGHWNPDTKQLTSDIPNEARLKEIEKVLKENVAELDKTLKNYTDSEVIKAKNELSASVRGVDEKVENLQFGGRNLLLGTNDLLKFVKMVGAKGDRSLEASETSRTGNLVKITNIVRTSSSSVISFNFKDIAPLFGVDLEEYVLSFYLKTNSEQKVNFLAYNTETISVTPKLISDKFQRVIIRLRPKALKKDVPHHNGNLYLVGENLTDLWIYDIKLEKGSIPTDWTPAPEDTENAINNVSNSLEPIRIRTTQVESGIKILQDKLLLTATKDDVTRVLDEKLQPIKNEVQQQNANIELLPNKLTEQVSQHIYETTISGLVKRLEAEESKRETLANQINDTVSIQQYQSGIQEAKEYADEQLEDVANNPGIKAGIQKANEEAQESLKEYVRAQDTLKQQESQAYIDGQISAEEQRAIEEARQKLAEAKRHAEDKANEAQRLSNSYTDGQIRDANRERDQILTRYDSQIQQNGREIALRTTKQEFNATNRTLSNVLAEIVQNVTDGTTLRYDDNGVAQSLNIGPQGIKIDTSKFVINDGDVIVQNGRTTIKDAYIDKLFSKQATIEYLKAIDVDLNKATVSGSRDGESTVLTGGKIRSTGSFIRSFPQGNVTYEAFTESWNGVYRAGLISKTYGSRKLSDIERWLALTDKGITTQREIHSKSPDKRGARFIDFFAEETYSSDVYGQGMHIYSGQDLKIEAGYRLSFESTNSWYTQFSGAGVEIINDGASLVLKRQTGFTSQQGSGGQYISLQASDGSEHGHIGVLSNNRHLSLKSSFGEVHLRGAMTKVLNAEGENLTDIRARSFDLSGVGRIAFENGDAYLQGQTGVRFTRYKSNTFVTAQAKDFVKASSRHLKTNIEDLKNGLETINQLKPVKYDYISDLQEGNTDGDIGFIAEDSPSISVNNGKAISVQKIATWAILGIQELSKENDDLQKQIADLKTKFDVLSEVIK
ncbi:tail fiber domain-containing protein [Staphylococcus pseudintermedius]|nr:tail fiber domain-containing protein [Staphylococcus pseudintermedius]